MRLVRIVVSDLHLSEGIEPGRPNPYEDFFFDEEFAELVEHLDARGREVGAAELILNGDIFDLLKVPIDGKFPREITNELAAERLRRCLEGHPIFVDALRRFLEREENRLTYLPGNHDIEMWLRGPQELLIRYLGGEAIRERIQFITRSDTYYLPEGIQIRHGHQLERIHRVDYSKMTREGRGGEEILNLPWGALWIIEVMNPLKERRAYIDRIQPLGRFMLASFFLDFRLFVLFAWWSSRHFLRHRVFALRGFFGGLLALPTRLRDEIFELTHGFDDRCARALNRARGVHTLIVGHSHGPRFIRQRSGKILVNTGTWMKMINLDLHHLGQDSGLTYALIEYDDEGQPQTRLMRFLGRRRIAEPIPYLD